MIRGPNWQINVILNWLQVDEKDLRTWVIDDSGLLSLWFKGEDDVREYRITSEPDSHVTVRHEKHWPSPVQIEIRKAMITEIAVRGSKIAKMGDGQAPPEEGLCDSSLIDDNGMHRCVKDAGHHWRHSSLTDRSKPWRKWW